LRYRNEGKRLCLPAGNDLLEAENRRKTLEVRLFAEECSDTQPVAQTQASAQPQAGRVKIADAVSIYFENLLAQGKDAKTIATYKIAVNGFVASFSKTFVDEIEKQDLFGYLAWLRKQPKRPRKNSNVERTYYNKVSHLAIFLKAFGKANLLKAAEYPAYDEKPVKAHTDSELNLLYAMATKDERFLLDYFLGSGVREGEASHAEFSDLTGNVLEIKRKPHLKWHPKKHVQRNIILPQFLADNIRARAEKSTSRLIFPNSKGRPNQHLLRTLQDLADRANAPFHTELHKLRKTCATRWAKYLPVHRIQKLLGHKNLETTMQYLADVDLEGGEMEAAVEAAAFIPKK
jgi:integrase